MRTNFLKMIVVALVAAAVAVPANAAAPSEFKVLAVGLGQYESAKLGF